MRARDLGRGTNDWLADILVRRRMFGPSITLFEVIACVIAVGGLTALNEWAVPEGVPLAVPSMAATAASSSSHVQRLQLISSCDSHTCCDVHHSSWPLCVLIN